MLDARSVFDTPFSVNSLTGQLVQDRALKSFVDLNRYDSSITVASNRVNYGDIVLIRGFSTNHLFDGLIGPFSRGTALTVDEYERIDVLKGSAEFLAGAVGFGPGGALNLVPKRAGDQPVHTLDLRYLSGSAFGAHLDVGDRFGPDKAVGARLNTTLEGGDINVDGTGVERESAFLALDYRTRTVRLNLDLDLLHLNYTGATPRFSVNPGVAVPRPPPLDRTYSQSWVDYPIIHFLGVFRAEWDPLPNLTVGYDVSGSRHNENGTYEGNGIIQSSAGAYTWSTLLNYDYNVDGIDHDLYLKAKARFAGVDHALTVQGSYGQNFGYFSPVATTFNVPSNLYAPVTVPRPADPPDSPAAKGLVRDRTSVIVADQADALGGRLQVILAGRYTDLTQQRYSGPAETLTSDIHTYLFTPAAAILVKPIKPLSLYFSYVEGLEYGAIAPLTAANRNDVTPPIGSKTYEAGAKLDLGGYGLTAAWFDVSREAAILNTVTNVFGVNGLEDHEGFEAQAFGAPLPGVKLIAGITYIDPVLSRTQGGAFDGNQAPGVPRFRGTATAEVEVPWLARGLSVYGTVARTGASFYDAANTQRVPGYTLGDLGLIWRGELAHRATTWRLNVENITDERYWAGVGQGGGTLAIGSPRTVQASVSLDF